MTTESSRQDARLTRSLPCRIQRFVFKLLISIGISREYKHDEVNRAWWTGKWYGRGMGTSAWTQPAREAIVKVCSTLMDMFPLCEKGNR